jgi:FdrA protein
VPAGRPRTLDSALRWLPGATLALISVPGLYAGAEARKALRAGLHVMLFSDNVPLSTEVELKRFARDRGLFLMGPDCGTAIINGVPLGFANAVPRGRIGVAAASGTGLQEVTCLIAAAGEGVSQAIGVGGRDLSEEVGGTMMEQALDALAADARTEVICVLGKPPGPSVLARLGERLPRLGKRCVIQLMGGEPVTVPGCHAAATLEDAAQAAVALARGEKPAPVHFGLPVGEVRRIADEAIETLEAERRFVRGVYSGGTLAREAVHLLASRLADVAASVTGGGAGHRVVDFGEDIFTVGRPHPMLDGTVRREWIGKEALDRETAVLLLDVVLGYGAHPDPAGEILPAIEAVRRSGRHGGPVIIASVCGTDDDPQVRSTQVKRLEAGGVIVLPSNAQAARLATLIAARLVESQR